MRQVPARRHGPGQGRLVAVVVTHRRLAQLRVTLAALLASPPALLAAVLVVDNASDDGPPGEGTQGFLGSLGDPRLHVLTLPENLGGAGGFAAGLRHAVAHLAPDWLLVMDDDARPEKGALAAFHARDLRGVDAVAAAVRHPDGTLCEMNRPTLDPFRHWPVLFRTLAGGGRGAFHLGPGDYAGERLRPVDGASFVGLFLRAAVPGAHGYPDPALFLYGDDAIYTLGLTRAGCRLAFDPLIRFEHDSETYRTDDPRIRPLWKVYYYHRNLTILYRRTAGLLFLPVMALTLPRWLLRLRHHRGERRVFLRLFVRALRDGWRGRTGRPHAEILEISAPAGRDDGGAAA